MSESVVPVTGGSGYNVAGQTDSAGNLRQTVTIGDPNSGVAPVDDVAGLATRNTESLVAYKDVTFDGTSGHGLGLNYATARLSWTGVNPSNGDTITIGSHTYTFVSGAFTAPNQVAITQGQGNGPFYSLYYLLSGTVSQEGLDYSTGSTNPMADTCNVNQFDGSTYLLLQSLNPGAAANSIATTDTSSVFSWGASTFVGGASGAPVQLFHATGTSLYTVVGITNSSLVLDQTLYPNSLSSIRTSVNNFYQQNPANPANLVVGNVMDSNGMSGIGVIPQTRPCSFVFDGEYINFVSTDTKITGGSMRFYCFYRPLEVGATITAAA